MSTSATSARKPSTKEAEPPPVDEALTAPVIDSADVRHTAETLAASVGLALSSPLKAHEITRLRKPSPSYVSVVDDAARRLQLDGARLHLTTVTAPQLLDLHARRAHLATVEVASHRVYRAAYEQRMVVDDEALGKLLLIERRVNTMAEEDPDLVHNWAFLINFLAEFRRKGASTTAAAPAPEPAPPVSSASVTLDISARPTTK